MRITFKKNTLRTDHFIAAAIILSFFVVCVASFHLWQAYKTQSHVRTQRITLQAEKLSAELNDTLDYVTNVLKFLGDKIAPTKGRDLDAISRIFNNQYVTNKNISDFFSWTGFDWTTPDDMLVVSTMHGVMSKPLDMSFRHYVKEALVAPGILHFDPPSQGKTSHQWVIPAGLGVTNQNKKYLGLISIGLNIAELGKRLEKSLTNSGLQFILLDQNLDTIYASNVPMDDLSLLQARIKSDVINSFPVSEGELGTPITYNNIDFSYYKKVGDYPFLVLVGYDNVIARSEFYDAVRVGGPEIILLGVLALMLIFVLRYVIVRPVKQLSETADDIVNKKPIHKFPRSTTYEINNLASKLLKLRRLIYKQDITQHRLKEANHIIRESDKEKEAFMRDMYQLLKEPIKVLKGGIFAVKGEKIGPLSLEKYGIYFDAMQDACNQLESFTTELLYPSQVNIAEIIRQCVAIHRRYATEQGVKITTDIPNSIPEIWADKLRLKQIILGTIYNSLLYVPENAGKMIHISAQAELHDDGTPALLEITLEDDGFGLSEREREEYWNEFFYDEDGYLRNADLTKQSIEVIRHLIKLHHGRFKLSAKSGMGAKFSIQLPYMEKADIETHPDLLRSRKKQEETDKMHADFHKNIRKDFGNIVEFPKKKSD